MLRTATNRSTLLGALMLLSLLLAGTQDVHASTVTYDKDFSETPGSVLLSWKRAYYQDLDIAGSTSMQMPFGLAKPNGYDSSGSTKYPLVLYLHGAGARGDSDAMMQRTTARFFAESAQTTPAYNAFVLAPQCASSHQWAETPFSGGPYTLGAGTYGEYMHLAENLLGYLADSGNNANLATALGINAAHIDLSRIYVVGDSMGAYGTWDIVARQPDLFAAAIASAGSGPKNKLTELLQTPFWAIHGENDPTVPNYLPHAGDLDGAGSLGMLGLIDPTFDGSTSTTIIYVDNPSLSGDDPVAQTLIYTEYSGAGHEVATSWTGNTSGIQEWLFAQAIPEPGTFLLIGVGGLMLALARGRKRS